MTTNITKTEDPKQKALSLAVEQAITAGNLAGLNSEQKLFYYNQVCNSVGLNPLTRPLDFIQLNGKLVLYAKKDATDQLRKIYNVSIHKVEETIKDGIIVVTAYARDKSGKEDSDMGAVPLPAAGEARANAMMKAVTKAKRRVTLSICGMGLLDESEFDTIPGAKGEDFTPAAKTETKTTALKAKLAAPLPETDAGEATKDAIADERDTPPPVPEAAKKKAPAATSAPIEPEVMPKAETPPAAKPARQTRTVKAPEPKAEVMPPIPEGDALGQTEIPFGVHQKKTLDDLSDDEIIEMADHFKKSPEPAGTKVRWFKRVFEAYVDQFGGLVEPEPIDTAEPDVVPPPPSEALAPTGAEAFLVLSINRIKAAKNMDELKAAWTQHFADAKDPKKINIQGIPTDRAVDFNKRALAAKEARKAELLAK